jgi:hypothetical protein
MPAARVGIELAPDVPTRHRAGGAYGGLKVSETKTLEALEEENRRLKRIVADQAVNLQVLKDVAGNE